MRKKPYTIIGIKHVPCSRCGAPSHATWQVCADVNQYRGVCLDCDIKINRMVMNFMLIPKRTEKINKYIKERKSQ